MTSPRIIFWGVTALLILGECSTTLAIPIETTSVSSRLSSSAEMVTQENGNGSNGERGTTPETPPAVEVKLNDDNSGNKNSSENTNMNYIIEYKPQSFESPEDIKTQQEWGGNCTLAHWDSCKVLSTWFGKYEDPKDEEIKEYQIDCNEEPVVCLKNSWTVTRCNLLCMSRCNREIQYKYDKYVSHSGECQAHAHG